MSEYGSVTQCPHCKTSFHVGPIQLEAAHGHVRCGGCLKVFDANQHFLIEQKPLFSGDIEEQVTEDEISIIPGALDDEEDADLMPPEESTESQPEEWAQEEEGEQEKAEAEEFSEENLATPEHLSEDADQTKDFEQEDQQDLPHEQEEDLQTDEINDQEEGPLEDHEEPSEESEYRFTDIEEVGEIDTEVATEASAQEEQELAEDKDEDIDHILDEAFDDLEENLASNHNQEEAHQGTPPEDDWQQPLIAERTGAEAEEPDFLSKPQINEEEALAEQLFVDGKKRRTTKKLSAPWVAGLTALFVTLFAQSMYWQPSSLRQSDFYNQVSLNYCALLPCRELILQDLSQLYITGLVRPSDEYNNALGVQVELRNRSDQPQRFPHIELAFTDLRGQKISLRRFSPPEYLRAETAGRTVLEPFQRVQIEMELYDPGASAISYEFNLLYLN